MQDITKVAEQLNSKVTQLNNERSRQLGMQESAKKQYENAVTSYEEKYGVKVSETNLQEEYNKVYAEVKGKVELLEETIVSIERGDYKNIEKPADIDLEPNVASIKPKTKVAAKVAEPAPVVNPVVDSTPIVQPVPIVNPVNLGESAPIVQPVNLGVVEEAKPAPVVTPAPVVAPIANPETVVAPVVAPTVSDDSDRPFWETAAPVAETVVPDSEPQIVPPTINFGGVASPAPSFGGAPLNFEVEDSFDEMSEGYDDADEVPTNLGVAPVVSATEEVVEEEEEVISPEGWGVPKTADDINKNFKDILGQSGIKFGE